MPLKLKETGSLIKTAFKEWWTKDPFKEGAAISFYAIFSMPGLLIVIITIAGYFFGLEAVNNRLSSQISSIMGADTARQIQDMVKIATESKNSIWATFMGIITILVGATGVFIQLQKSLNLIWQVKADDSRSGIWNLIRARIFSFGLLLAITFIMMVSFIVTTILIAMGDWLSSHFSDSLLIIIQIINFIVSRLIIAALFALMFKFLPDAKIKWNHVWPGSIVTALLFLLGMYGMSLYFGKAQPGSGYGSAGSIILILLWVAYSSMIVFYGAEFTHAYAVQHDGYIPPDNKAVKTKTKKVIHK
jgi:membrane protein